MLPKGWRYEKLENLAKVERGKFTVRPRNDPRYYGGSIPFVQTGDVASANGFLSRYSQTLNDEGLKVSKLFPKGSILVTIAANIGDVAITSIDVACPDSIVVVQSNSDVSNQWLRYALTSQKKIMDSEATQNAQKNINLQVLRPLKILTPPLSEQKKIAEILGAWDEAIALTEKAIVAKKKLKNFFLKNLISEPNLSDFEGNWEKKRFIEVGNLVYGKGLSKQKYLNSGETKIFGTAGLLGYTSISLSKGPSVIVPRKGSLDNIFYIDNSEKFWTIDTTFYLDSDQNMKFMYYLLNSLKLSRFNESTGVPSLNRNSLHNLKIYIPDLETQFRIVSIIDCIELEIQYNQQKLFFILKQKQGLMQKLLTGKWRVTVESEA